MRKKAKKINSIKDDPLRPPKAKVVRSNRAGCTTLPLPMRGQVIEIPQGYEVLERIAFEDFEPKLTLFLRRTDPKRFENDLKSHRGTNRRARSA